MKYNIRIPYDGNKKFSVNEKEELFFDAVYEQFGDTLTLERLSDGTLNVLYARCQIGRVKLQGRKYKMQILKTLLTVKWIEGDVDDFIPHIQDWKKYKDRYLKNGRI